MYEVEVRPLSFAEAVAHQRSVEALAGLIGGECVHAEGELLHAEQFQDLRYEMSQGAWLDGTLVGVLLACRWSADQANAEFAYGPGLGSMQGYQYPDASFQLDHMAVAPEHRGQGIAERLLRAWLSRSEALGLRDSPSQLHWSLETRVATPPTTAQRLYERHGFAVVGQRTFGGQHVDHVMWRSRRYPD